MEELIITSKDGRMSSLEIAQITEREHKDVMRSIRNMEESWLKIAGRNFALGTYKDANKQDRPCYYLTKTECLYVATKFNDEARAKLVLRWEQLEIEKRTEQSNLSPAEMLLKQCQIMVEHEKRLSTVEQKVNEVLAIREEAQKDMLSLPLSTDAVPELSMRDKVRALVNKYSMHFNVPQKNVWDHIYQTLYYNYHIALRSYARKKNESLIDVAERVGALDKMYAIISNLSRQNGLVA